MRHIPETYFVGTIAVDLEKVDRRTTTACYAYIYLWPSTWVVGELLAMTSMGRWLILHVMLSVGG